MQAIAVLSFLALQLVLPPDRKESSAVLQFKWPEGLEARVETERTREQQTNDKVAPSRTVKGAYRMRARPHEAGLIVRHEEFSGLQMDEVVLSGVGIEDLVASLVPSTVVTPAGDFVRAEDTAVVKNVLARLVEPFVADKKDLPPTFKQMMEHLTSDEFLNATAASEWNALIGAWVEFPIGDDVFEQTIQEPSPVLPDLMVPMRITQRMLAKEECVRGAARYQCAVFEMRTEVERVGMQELLARLMEGMKELSQKISYDEFDLVTIVRVRLETATMLPHELTMTRTMNLKMSAPDLPSVASRQVDRRRSTFSY